MLIVIEWFCKTTLDQMYKSLTYTNFQVHLISHADIITMDVPFLQKGTRARIYESFYVCFLFGVETSS